MRTALNFWHAFDRRKTDDWRAFCEEWKENKVSERCQPDAAALGGNVHLDALGFNLGPIELDRQIWIIFINSQIS